MRIAYTHSFLHSLGQLTYDRISLYNLSIQKTVVLFISFNCCCFVLLVFLVVVVVGWVFLGGRGEGGGGRGGSGMTRRLVKMLNGAVFISTAL